MRRQTLWGIVVLAAVAVGASFTVSGFHLVSATEDRGEAASRAPGTQAGTASEPIASAGTLEMLTAPGSSPTAVDPGSGSGGTAGEANTDSLSGVEPGPAGDTDPTAQPPSGLPTTPEPSSLTGYRWPIDHPRLTNHFGPSWYGAFLVNGERFHDGLDLATFCGDHVYAAHDGLVIAAGRHYDPWMGWVGDLGAHTKRMEAHNMWGGLPIVVVIDDGNGYRSIYAHFNAIKVKAGQRVRAGQFLGWEGSTGFASGCHLHYGLFSPYATGRFRLRPDVAKRTKYPDWEIARINPLRVLPDRTPSTSPPPSSQSPSVGTDGR